MVQENERYLAERSEYHLRVPKVPRQSVDVFGRDIKNGYYGLSAENIEVLFSYTNLQRTLDSFDDLTFSADFIGRLPEELKGKLGENLFPNIVLADLEIPTTDKILLARMLAADRLTETLSETPVDVWVSPQTQKDLEELGVTTDIGLQQIDYGQLSLQAKLELVEIMEQQEAQAHIILAARQHFPKGVPPTGFSALLSGKTDRTTFDNLTDLETQFSVARQAIDNPFLVHFSELMEEARKKPKSNDQETRPDVGLKDILDVFPIEIEEEAQGEWWHPGEFSSDYKRYDEVFRKVAAFLKPKYANKTIYEIMGADTDEAKEEVLAAFWRTGEPRNIDFGDKSYLINDLYLHPDGTLELHFHDDAFGDRENSIVTGDLNRDEQVAMIDQAVKWINVELQQMKQ